MKSKKYLFLLFIILCISFTKINYVYADNFDIICDKNTIEVNEETNCKVTGTTEHIISGVIGSLGSNNNLEITNITNISPFTVMTSEPIYYFGNQIGRAHV